MTQPSQKKTCRVRETAWTRWPRTNNQALTIKHAKSTGENSQGFNQLSQSIVTAF
jgi:hypothetical protein